MPFFGKNKNERDLGPGANILIANLIYLGISDEYHYLQEIESF